MFALLIPFTGLGILTAEIALVSYTILILVGNTVAGLDAVPESVKEAADGMGYTRWRRLLTVEIPLALPTIIAGIRVAAVTVIGLVTIAALDRHRWVRRTDQRRTPPQLSDPDRDRRHPVDLSGAARRRWSRDRATSPHSVAARTMNVIRGTIEFLTTGSNWTGEHGILARGWAHVWISFVAVMISASAAIPAAVWLAHKRLAPTLVGGDGQSRPGDPVVRDHRPRLPAQHPVRVRPRLLADLCGARRARHPADVHECVRGGRWRRSRTSSRPRPASG